MKGLYLILTGARIAILIEITALAAGQWAYTSLMLVIPALNMVLLGIPGKGLREPMDPGYIGIKNHRRPGQG